MNKLQTIIFIIFVGCLYFLFVFGEEFNLDFIPDKTIPPPLSDLFPNREKGPHQEFVSEEGCLACHQMGINIPNIGKAPKIKHEFRKDCTSCHLLPKVQIK